MVLCNAMNALKDWPWDSLLPIPQLHPIHGQSKAAGLGCITHLVRGFMPRVLIICCCCCLILWNGKGICHLITQNLFLHYQGRLQDVDNTAYQSEGRSA